jgi:hypothetical protein
MYPAQQTQAPRVFGWLAHGGGGGEWEVLEIQNFFIN